MKKVQKKQRNAAAVAGKKRKIRLGLRGTMLLVMVTTLVVVLGVTGSILLRKVNREVGRLIDDNIKNQAKNVQIQCEDYFSDFFGPLRVVASTHDVRELFNEVNETGIRFEESERAMNVRSDLTRAVDVVPEGIQSLYIASSKNNEVMQHDGVTSDPGFRLEDREWYQQLLAAKGKASVTGAYQDQTTGNLVVTIAVPVYQGANIVGAVGADISLENLNKKLSSFTVGKTGYGVVFDGENDVIYHPDNSLILTNMKDINYSPEMQEAVLGNQNVESIQYSRGDLIYHGTTYYLPNIGWQVIGCMPEQEYRSFGKEFTVTVLNNFGIMILVLAALTTISITGMVRPIKKLEKVASQLADGELDVEVDTHRKDEIGDLAASITRMVDRLKNYVVYIGEISDTLEQMSDRNMVFELHQDYVGEFQKLKTGMHGIQESLSTAMFHILDAAQQVDNSSSNMADASQALAQGATEQASSVEELASAVQELTTQAVHEADKAVETSKSAVKIGEDVQEGNRQMQRMLEAMNNISTHSSEIEKIVKVSEDIAFQTNILALNAAVEAARAGSAGKGFAVVADEVRNLAGKSADSAKTIADLIQSTITAVNQGAEIANLTAQSLDKITAQMGDVVHAIDDIADQYQSESLDLKQIADGIDQVSAVVQTNSATAEESAATAEELAEQVRIMKDMVADFQLDDKFRQQ